MQKGYSEAECRWPTRKDCCRGIPLREKHCEMLHATFKEITGMPAPFRLFPPNWCQLVRAVSAKRHQACQSKRDEDSETPSRHLFNSLVTWRFTYSFNKAQHEDPPTCSPALHLKRLSVVTAEGIQSQGITCVDVWHLWVRASEWVKEGRTRAFCFSLISFTRLASQLCSWHWKQPLWEFLYCLLSYECVAHMTSLCLGVNMHVNILC